MAQAGELGAEAGQKGEAAVPTPLGIDGHACGRERVDVAQHRARRDLEFAGERLRRQSAPLPQQEDEGDEPVRTHVVTLCEYLTGDVVIVGQP